MASRTAGDLGSSLPSSRLGADARGELVDVLAANGTVVETVSKVLADVGDYTFANVVIFIFDPKENLWLQKRAKDADTHRELLDASACGAVQSGENTLKAAYREQFEEMGFNCPLERVDVFMNTFVAEDGTLRRRMSTVFIGFSEQTPKPGRGVEGFVSLPVDKVIEFVKTDPDRFFPSLAAELEYGRSALRARRDALGAASRRHPAAGWRHVSRDQDQLLSPHTVDLRIVGTCQLRGPWCWGPEHTRAGSVTPDEWRTTIAELARSEVRQVILSGGEPTLSRALRPCVAEAKTRGMAVTLSTNGIRLNAFEDVVCAVDDIGIPIDGSTPAMNDRMRDRSLRFDAWSKAIDAMKLVENLKSEGRSQALVTVRTVVARPNLHNVIEIPAVLMLHGLNLSDTRIRLYQVEPFGPHVPQIEFDRDWAVTSDQALETVGRMKARYPGVRIELQLFASTVGRYCLVDPDGLATGTDQDAEGMPVEVPYGNIVRDFANTMARYRSHHEGLRSRQP